MAAVDLRISDFRHVPSAGNNAATNFGGHGGGGGDLAAVCHSCGNVFAVDSKWCGNCGERRPQARPRPASKAVASSAPLTARSAATKSATTAQATAVGARGLLARRRVAIWLGAAQPVKVPVLEGLSRAQHPEASVSEVQNLEHAAAMEEASRHFVSAAERLDAAVKLRCRLFGDASERAQLAADRACSLFNNWGSECLAAAQFTAALELFKRAEALTEVDGGPAFPRKATLRAVTFNNMCCYFRQRGKLNAALQFAEKAVRIEQRFKEAHEPSRTLLNYAVLLSAMNRHEEAIEQIHKGTAIIRDEMRMIEANDYLDYVSSNANAEGSDLTMARWLRQSRL
eukprot:TRINITY_DN26179_c0_g1_i2.p1 TRINITY_DN26179_c0_g1~~TRINITY_DN26179_c0_g1_i2.p1  ORF type:complete len:342 (-),score=86.21 TRINITY_DN26179_c0_g1_i2:214-1239(-)